MSLLARSGAAPDTLASTDAESTVLVHPHVEPAEPWQALAVRSFTERMLDDEDLFPCIFGVDAVRKGTLRYAFIPAGPDRVAALREALVEFTRIAPELGRRTSLVCFSADDPELDSLDRYREHFWALLQDLHAADEHPWPAGIATDPEDPTWEFSFNGMPMFVVANTPAHHLRRSRYLEHFTITFQPRFVFDDLRAGTPGGDKSRRIIRDRLADYDRIELTPLLGSFGAPGNKEWQQYFLADDNVVTETLCPFRHQASSPQHTP